MCKEVAERRWRKNEITNQEAYDCAERWTCCIAGKGMVSMIRKHRIICCDKRCFHTGLKCRWCHTSTPLTWSNGRRRWSGRHRRKHMSILRFRHNERILSYWNTTDRCRTRRITVTWCHPTRHADWTCVSSRTENGNGRPIAWVCAL